MLEVALYGFSIGLIGAAKYGSKQSTDIDGCCLSAENMSVKTIFPYYNPARGMRQGRFVPLAFGITNTADFAPCATSAQGGLSVDHSALDSKVTNVSTFELTLVARGKRKPLFKNRLMKRKLLLKGLFLTKKMAAKDSPRTEPLKQILLNAPAERRPIFLQLCAIIF